MAIEAVLMVVLNKIVDSQKLVADLWKQAARELKLLESELQTLACFLKDAAEKQETDQRVRYFVKEITETLYEAEDILEGMALVYASRMKLGGYIIYIFKRFLAFELCFSSHEVNKITMLRQKVRFFNKSFELNGINKTTGIEGVKFSEQAQSCKNSLVGMKDEVEKVVNILLDKQQDQACCPIIAILGMGGIGKTTLAKRVYNDPQVQTHFEGFAWAKVSQNFQTRKVFQDIFSQLVPGSEEEISTFSDLELLQQLFEIQLSKKYLIILDDVCDIDAWKCLNLAFPLNKSPSKLVITTRSTQVAEQIAEKGFAHKMRTLTTQESWELFLEKASSGADPGEMQMIGKDLVKKCSGLPLAITLLGKLLENKQSLNEWKVVHQRIDLYSSTVFGSQEFSKIPEILALKNYHDLPHYLKPCFLYFGLFPEGSEIESEKLYQLWITEGLIPSITDKSLSKMEIAEEFLDELVSRNMVHVQEENPLTSTRFKTIHLLDLMHHISLLKGKEDGFIEVMDMVKAKNQINTCYSTARRLALYVDKKVDKHFISFKKDKARTLRSLLLLNVNLHQKVMSSPPEVSTLKQSRSLRILHFDRFTFEPRKSLKGIENLTSLRYLSLSQCVLDELPSSIGNLCNLETLDLRVQISTWLNVPNVLWKIQTLRHLYLPVQFRVHQNERLRLDTLINLETLQNFDTSLCNGKDLVKLTKLHRSEMTVQGNLDDLEIIANHLSTMSKWLHQSSLNIKSLNGCSRRKYSIFRHLFECPALYSLHIEGHIDNLPQMISPGLTELVLSGAELYKDPMETLEKFPRLWILVLNNDAFCGKQMVCSASGFPQLRLLRLLNLNNLEKITIEKGAMPNLSTLAIERCKRLEVLPQGFNHLTSLRNTKIAGREFWDVRKKKKLRIVIDQLQTSNRSATIQVDLLGNNVYFLHLSNRVRKRREINNEQEKNTHTIYVVRPTNAYVHGVIFINHSPSHNR